MRLLTGLAGPCHADTVGPGPDEPAPRSRIDDDTVIGEDTQSARRRGKCEGRLPTCAHPGEDHGPAATRDCRSVEGHVSLLREQQGDDDGDQPVLPDLVAAGRPVGENPHRVGIDSEPTRMRAHDDERPVLVSRDQQAPGRPGVVMRDARRIESDRRTAADLHLTTKRRRTGQPPVGEGTTDAISEERSLGHHLGYRSPVAIRAETIVRRREDVITEAVHDDVVVLDPKANRYVRLNAASATLWEALAASPSTVAMLAHILEEHLTAPPEQALPDALAFVEAMFSRNLVELSTPT